MTQSSSVVFSLQELERMEEERVRAQVQRSEHERQARQRSLLEERERVRLEREERERVEAEARRAVERAAREEAARLEAIRLAGIEGARALAEARARADERDLVRRHELELERTRALTRSTGLRSSALAAAFGAVISAGLALALHLGVLAPRERARLALASAELASRDAVIGQLQSHVEATDARMRTVEGELATARGDNDQLRADLQAARRPIGAPPPRRGPVGIAPRADTPRLDGFTSCPPGSQDPLCVH